MPHLSARPVLIVTLAATAVVLLSAPGCGSKATKKTPVPKPAAAGTSPLAKLAPGLIRESVCRGESLSTLGLAVTQYGTAATFPKFPELQPVVSCGEAATCEAFNACAGSAFDEAPPATCEADGSTCEGDVVLTCVDGKLERDDCAARGGGCHVADGQAACVMAKGACSVTACRANGAVTCHGGRIAALVPCPSLGADYQCSVDSAGDAMCDYAGEDVCESDETRCDGSVARICFDGRWLVLDCASFQGASCAEAGGLFGGLKCVAPGSPAE